VLFTPLADLLSEHQRRKLPATSNAVRHEINKRVSAVPFGQKMRKGVGRHMWA